MRKPERTVREQIEEYFSIEAEAEEALQREQDAEEKEFGLDLWFGDDEEEDDCADQGFNPSEDRWEDTGPYASSW